MVGFIEVTNDHDKKYLVSLSAIDNIHYDEEEGCVVIVTQDRKGIFSIRCKESYEEIKYKLREVLV